MNDLEQLMADELGRLGDVAAPEVDVVGLARLGARERRRSRGLVAGAAAAVAVVAAVTVPQVLSDEQATPGPTAPTEVSDLPVGSRTDVPWWSDGALHVGGDSWELPQPESVRYRGGTTLVQAADAWWVAEMGRAPVTLPTEDVDDIRISGDGDTLAWVEPRGEGSLVVVYSVADAVVLDTLEHPRAVVTVNVLDDGRVLLTRGAGRDELWAAADGEERGGADQTRLLTVGDTIEASQPPSSIMHVSRGAGVLLTPGGYSDGRTELTSGLWNTSGSTIAAERPGGGIVVERRPITTVDMALPTAERWNLVAWEDEAKLLVVSGTPDAGALTTGSLVRCDIFLGECERVADGPEAPALMADYPDAG